MRHTKTSKKQTSANWIFDIACIFSPYPALKTCTSQLPKAIRGQCWSIVSDGSDNSIRWRISEVCVILKKDLSLNINYNIDWGEMQKCRAGRWGVGAVARLLIGLKKTLSVTTSDVLYRCF